MIIKLKNADFSANNIGTLSTWTITRVLGSGTTYDGPLYVDKDAAFNATVTISDGYELGTAGVTVTMGGEAVASGVTVDGNTITIAIASVTGNVVIKVPTINTSTGEEEEPEIPDNPGVGDDEEINLTDKFTWTAGGVKYANGKDATDANWKRSNYVDVSGCSSITFTHIQTTTADTSLGYAFYDSSKQYISGANNAGSSYVPVEKTIDVPSNAVYFRCMWMNTGNPNYDAAVHDISKFYCYGNKNSESGGNTPGGNTPGGNTPGGGGTGEEINITSQFEPWTAGTITHATGSTNSSDTAWLYSSKVEVGNYSKLRFMQCQTTNATTSLGYAFYNSSGNRISGASNSGSSYNPVEKTIDVPSGAVYFRCMWMNTTNKNYTELNNKDKFYCYGID